MTSENIKQLAEMLIDKSLHPKTENSKSSDVIEILNMYEITPKTGPVQEMLIGNCFHLEEWDYNGLLEYTSKDIEMYQTDWNATLMTKINLISAKIHMASLRSSVDYIMINPLLKNLFKTLPYYKDNEFLDKNDVVCGGEFSSGTNHRFSVVYDNNIPKDEIFMVNKDWNDILFVAETTIGETTINEDGNESTEMGIPTFEHISKYSDDKVLLHNSKLIGCIKIKNFSNG